MARHEITRQGLAKVLNGCEYGMECTNELKELAKENGLVIVYGGSDDLMILSGAIDDRFDCYDGDTAYLDKDGLVYSDFTGECEDCKLYKNHLKSCKTIEAVWCDKDIGCSWSYKTDIPHSTFDVMEGSELYCKGIVFEFNEYYHVFGIEADEEIVRIYNL